VDISPTMWNQLVEYIEYWGSVFGKTLLPQAILKKLSGYYHIVGDELKVSGDLSSIIVVYE
jgi:hypothetical protein